MDFERCGTFHSYLTTSSWDHSHSVREREKEREREKGLLTTSTWLLYMTTNWATDLEIMTERPTPHRNNNNYHNIIAAYSTALHCTVLTLNHHNMQFHARRMLLSVYLHVLSTTVTPFHRHGKHIQVSTTERFRVYRLTGGLQLPCWDVN